HVLLLGPAAVRDLRRGHRPSPQGPRLPAAGPRAHRGRRGDPHDRRRPLPGARRDRTGYARRGGHRGAGGPVLDAPRLDRGRRPGGAGRRHRPRGHPRGRGGGAVIVTRPPLRISIGGGGTDLPSYYRRAGGTVISAAIDKYIYLSVNGTFTD